MKHGFALNRQRAEVELLAWRSAQVSGHLPFSRMPPSLPRRSFTFRLETRRPDIPFFAAAVAAAGMVFCVVFFWAEGEAPLG